MPRLRFDLVLICLTLILSACAPTPVAAPPTPTDRIQSLPQNVPTLTPQPTLTPPPTKIFLSPTPLANATATLVPSIYTAAPGTETTDAAATPSRTLNILLYEDTGDIGPWVKLTLDKMELQYTYVVGSGDLLKQLQSDTQWSLIIIASENQSSVQGDLWDLITQKVNTGSASLLAEMWSIDLIYQGKIKPFLDTCGVTLSSHYNLPRAVPVYLIDSQNAIFNTPNPGISLLKPIYHWDDQAVDYLQLLPDSHAKILAGGVEGDQNDNALITSCFDGRVILQTFLNHDYPEATIKALWENYITFMITTHK